MGDAFITRRGGVAAEPEPVFTVATGGTTLTYSDGTGKFFKSHTFTSNGTFEVVTVGEETGDRNKVDYLIIAGGGGGGGFAGGGGAGGYRTTVTPTPGNTTPNSKITVTPSTYPVVVGAGANGATSFNNGGTGSNSSVFSVTANGGGGGSGNNGAHASPGGSGGGAGSPDSATGSHFRNPGSGVSGQGFAGGTNSQKNNGGRASGGGGGASQVGEAAKTTGGWSNPGTNSCLGGNGGNGLNNDFRTGTNEARAGGGAGSLGRHQNASSTLGQRSLGGGGRGWFSSTTNVVTYVDVAGLPNTGGGGGGNRGADGSSALSKGGSGIVIIRYEIAPN